MEEAKISIIAAMDEKRGIGKGNSLLFKIPEDFKRMKMLTTGHPIIMGRKTYESIGRVLPNRTNIIVTRDVQQFLSHHPELSGMTTCLVVHSLEEAIKKAKESEGANEIFIFGGGEIFRQASPLVEKLYLTIVKGDFGADTFFPDYSEFTKEVFRQEGEHKGLRYAFVDLKR